MCMYVGACVCRSGHMCVGRGMFRKVYIYVYRGMFRKVYMCMCVYIGRVIALVYFSAIVARL